MTVRLYPCCLAMLAIGLGAPASGADKEKAPADPLTAEQREKLRQADAEGERAATLRAEGRRADARAALEKQLSLYRQVFGAVHRRIAESLETLIDLQEEGGDYAAAGKTVKELLAVTTRLDGEDHWRTSDVRWLQKRYERLAGLSAEDRRRFRECREAMQGLEDLAGQQKYRDGLETAQRALTVYKELLPAGHPDTASVLLWLGWFREEVGEYTEAERLYQEAGKIRKAAGMEVHPEYVKTLNNLGLLAQKTGDAAAAEAYLRQAVAVARKVWGENDAGLGQALRHLAWLFDTLGDQAQAEEFYRQSLGVYRRASGKQSAAAVAVLNDLAALFEKAAAVHEGREDYAAAGKARREVFTLLREQFGPEHWRTTDARWNLNRDERRAALDRVRRLRLLEVEDLIQQARELEGQRKFREAIGLAEKCDAAVGELLGREHPDRAGCLNWLGWFHYQAEQYDRAITFYQQALKLREKQLGKGHPDCGVTLNNLGLAHEYAGDLDKAEPFYRQALAILREARGDSHNDVALVHGNLVSLLDKRARRYEEREDFAAALRTRREVLTLQTERHGRQHHLVKDAAWAVARVEQLAQLSPQRRRRLLEADTAIRKVNDLIRQKKYREALPPCQDARTIHEEVLGKDHLDYGTTLSLLGVLHYRLQEYEKTEPLWLEALRIYRRVLGEQHPTCVQRLQNLDSLYTAMAFEAERRDDMAAAEAAQAKRLEVRVRQHGSGHPLTAAAQLDLELVRRLAKLDAAQRRRLAEADALARQLGPLDQAKKYREALEPARRVVEIRRDLLGTKDRWYAASLHDLAWFHDNLKEYDKAVPLYREAAEIREQVLGRDHPDYATTLHNLASVYLAQNDPARALPLYREALRIKRKVAGDKDAGTIHSLSGLATATSQLAVRAERADDFAEARKHRRDLVALVTRLRGPGHWQVINARLALSHLEALARLEPEQRRSLEETDDLLKQVSQLSDQGKAKEALPRAEKVLRVRRELLGEEHRDVATALHWLALLYDKDGQRARAEPLYVRAVALRARLLGEEHPDYLTSLGNLGLDYVRDGEYLRAEPLLRQALRGRKKVLATGHVDYATSLNNLGWLYDRMGEYSRAEPLYREAVEVKKKATGERNRSYVTSLNNLALLCEKKNDLVEAAKLLRRVRALREQLDGAAHALTTQADRNLARVAGLLAERYVDEDRLDEARPLCEEAASLCLRLYGETDWRTTDARLARDRLARLTRLDRPARQRLREARQWLHRAAEIGEPDQARAALADGERAAAAVRELLGRETADMADVLHVLGVLRYKAGELEAAEAALREAVAIRRKVLGERHPHYAVSLHNQGGLLAEMGRKAAAVPLLREAARLRKQVLGENSQAYKDSLTVLADVQQQLAAALEEKDALAECRQVLRERADVQRQRFGEGHWRATDARLDVARVERLAAIGPGQRRRLKEADQFYREAVTLIDAEKFREAMAPARRALEIRREILGDDDRAVADSQALLGLVYFLLRDHERALALCARALETRKRLLGEEHPDYAGSLGDLAGVYFLKGDKVRSETYLRQAAAILMKWHGQGDSMPVRSLKDAALMYEMITQMYRQDGEFPAARRACQELLALRTRLYGKDHPEVKAAHRLLNELDRWERLDEASRAELKRAGELRTRVHQLWQEEKYQEALPLAREAAALSGKHLGTEDADYALDVFNLARQYEGLGELAEADRHLREAAAIWLRVLGPEAEFTRTALEVRADVAGRRGAEALRREDLPAARDSFQVKAVLQAQLLGKDSWQAIDARLEAEYVAALHDLPPEQRRRLSEADRLLGQAGRLYREGRVVAGINAARRAAALRRQVLGGGHARTADALFVLASFCNAADLPAEAEALLPAVVAVRREVLGEWHPDYATSLAHLGYSRMQLGDLPRAEPLLREALAIRKKVFGEQSAAYALSLRNLGLLHRARGDLPRARALLQQALEIDSARDEGPANAGRDRYFLGLLLLETGDLAGAEKCAGEALQACRRDPGTRQPEYARDLALMAKVRQARGDLELAGELYEQAAEVLRETVGETHPEYAECLKRQALLADRRGDGAKAGRLLRQSARISRLYLKSVRPFVSESGQRYLIRSLRGHLDAYLSMTSKTDTTDASAQSLPLLTLTLLGGSVLGLLRWRCRSGSIGQPSRVDPGDPATISPPRRRPPP